MGDEATLHPSQKRLSCERCRKKKLRCLREDFAAAKCTRCARLGMDCVAGQQRKVGRPRRGKLSRGEENSTNPNAELTNIAPRGDDGAGAAAAAAEEQRGSQQQTAAGSGPSDTLEINFETSGGFDWDQVFPTSVPISQGVSSSSSSMAASQSPHGPPIATDTESEYPFGLGTKYSTEAAMASADADADTAMTSATTTTAPFAPTVNSACGQGSFDLMRLLDLNKPAEPLRSGPLLPTTTSNSSSSATPGSAMPYLSSISPTPATTPDTDTDEILGDCSHWLDPEAYVSSSAPPISAHEALKELSKLNVGLHARTAAAEAHRDRIGFMSIIRREGVLFIDGELFVEFLLCATQDFLRLLVGLKAARRRREEVVLKRKSKMARRNQRHVAGEMLQAQAHPQMPPLPQLQPNPPVGMPMPWSGLAPLSMDMGVMFGGKGGAAGDVECPDNNSSEDFMALTHCVDPSLLDTSASRRSPAQLAIAPLTHWNSNNMLPPAPLPAIPSSMPLLSYGQSPSSNPFFPGEAPEPLSTPLALVISSVYVQLLTLLELVQGKLDMRGASLGSAPIEPVEGLLFGGLPLTDICAQGVVFTQIVLHFLERTHQALGIGGPSGAVSVSAGPGMGMGSEPLLSAWQREVLWGELEEGMNAGPGDKQARFNEMPPGMVGRDRPEWVKGQYERLRSMFASEAVC